MEKGSKTFLRKVYEGEMMLEEAVMFVRKWEEGDRETPLYEAMGLTDLEYRMWLHDARNIRRFYFRQKRRWDAEGREMSPVEQMLKQKGLEKHQGALFWMFFENERNRIEYDLKTAKNGGRTKLLARKEMLDDMEKVLEMIRKTKPIKKEKPDVA